MDELDELAEALYRAVPAGVGGVRLRLDGGVLDVEVRRLARVSGGVRGDESEARASGGVSIAVALPLCRHEPGPCVLAGRLGPGWSPGQFKSRARYLIERGRETYRLRSLKDLLWGRIENYFLAATLAAPEAAIGKRTALEMAMAADAARSGYCDVLAEMDERDVRHWLAWLDAYLLPLTE